MIKSFLRERLSWIFFFLFLHVLILFVAIIDPAIPFLPILYIVFLSGICFTVFLLLRYRRETKFYQSLKEWEHELELSNITEPERPFEQIVAEQMTKQTDFLKKVASDNLLVLEQEKDDLLSWVHEVKTPLTTMHLMIDRVGDANLKEDLTYEWLRIHHLLDQQLHQRRIHFMENDLFVEETNIKDIIIEEIRALQSWCMQKGVGFDLDLQSIPVLSDGKWLAFILRQILTNAVKYSRDSDINIKTFVRNGLVVLEIKDLGRGIDEKDLPRIFDRGFTSTTHHHDHAATGMGLYLTKKAAQKLFIHIEVQSQLGEGTTFTLTFPRKNDFQRTI